jgi:signal transduction histidine kinase
MLPEELPRIWKRLYRCDQSRSQSGLGLGLSLVKAIMAVDPEHIYIQATHEGCACYFFAEGCRKALRSTPKKMENIPNVKAGGGAIWIE